MGNVCCTDRRINHTPTKSIPSNPTTLSPSIPQKLSPNPSNRRMTKLSGLNEFPFQNSLVEVKPSKNQASEELDMKESFIEELEYDLIEAVDLSQQDQNSILKLFTQFSNEIPPGDEELYEGYIVARVHESETYSEERALVVSTHAVYILKENDLSYMHRRLRLENILIVILEARLGEMIVHVSSNELLGDLWIASKQIEDLHNCLQTMFKYLNKRYIPTQTLQDKLFRDKFNKVPQAMLQSLLSEENLQANNVIVQEGKIGENVLFNKKAKWVDGGEIKDCRAVLTSKALYCLGVEFEFLSRMDLKLVKGARINENVDKVVIEKSNGEEILWFLSSKFVTELEKAIALTRKERINIVTKDNIRVEDFLQKNNKKIRRY